MRTEDLLLRCYAYRKRDGSWYAVCIDLNLDAEAPSLQQAKRSLSQAIGGYLETVLDTNNRESLVYLLRRPSPLSDQLRYHLIKGVTKLDRFLQRCATFIEAVPVQLAAHSCA